VTFLVGLVILLAGGAFAFVTLYGPGEELARAVITEEQPGSLTFEMPDERVELFAEIDLVMEDLPYQDGGDVPDLPHALDYQVQVFADGELVFDRACEAIYPRFFDWSSKTTDPDHPLSVSRTRLQYLGRLEHCTISAESGQTITVGAHRIWLIDAYRAYVRRTELAAKLPGLFSGL
jgi:hypothetical protein